MDSVEVRLIRVGTIQDDYLDISSCVLMEGWSIEVGLNEVGRCRFKWLARSTEDLPPCLGDRIRVRNVTDGGPMAGVFSHEVFTGIIDRMTQTDSGYGVNIWEVEVRQWPNIDRVPSGGAASGGYFVPASESERFTIPAEQMEPGSVLNVTVWGSGGGGGAAGAGGRGGSGTIRKKVQESQDGPKVVEEPGRRKIRKEEL